MKEFIAFIKDILMIAPADNRVGLSQFRAVETPVERNVVPSINAKNVKLSDLMRRAS